MSITTGVAPALQSIQRDWQFVTGAAVPEYSTPTLPLDVRLAARTSGTKSTPRLTISTRGAAVGRTATFRARRTRKVCRPKCATRPVGATTITRVRLAAVRRMSLPRLRTGDAGWSVTLTAPAFTVGGVKYRAYSVTRTIRASRPR